MFRAVLILLASPILAIAGVDFNRDVQPILSENCYHCHGPDGNARKAELRLDRKEGAFRTKDDVTPVVPGDPAKSELVTRIFSKDPEEVMPTPKSHRTLTEAQKQTLKRWVEEGAKWGEHWAFVAPVRPAVPGIGDLRLPIADWKNGADGFGDWGRNPVDAFILKKLAEEKLMPSREASPETLIRRITLDLTGLPATLAEIDAFVAAWNAAPSIDNRQSAIENLVDRLLASPLFGERMVWEWLDAARYADTNGYQGDPTRAMWYWRDWAIKALNSNMSFDQFTVEQLAGDLLPNATQDQLIATGFHRNHMINGEGGRIAEESRVDYVQDRVETTATVWLGLTMTCCRCHDHKYDQLTQREYYQLSAYFNSIEESGGGGNDGQGLANPTIALPSPESEKKIAELKAAEERVKNETAELEKKARDAQPEWEQALIAGAQGGQPGEVKWTTLMPDELYSDKGATLTKSEDGTVMASGTSPEKDEYVVNIHAKMGGITAFKLDVLPDASFKNGGPGRAEDAGNFVLSTLSLQGSGRPVDLAAVSADYEQGGTYTAKGPFDNDPKTGWAIYPEMGKPHTLVFEARNQVGYSGDEVLLAFRMSFQYGQKHTLGKFRLSATNSERALLRPMPDNIRAILAKAADQRSPQEKDELTKHYLNTSPQFAAAKDQREAAKKAREGAEQALPRTMVMHERAKPRDTFILVKGAYDKYADKVEHGTPAVLPPLSADAPKNRLALARWLVAPEHPLTARVTTNRFWQMFFGRGLVKTLEDFGVQGDKPTHPELLDWLAVDFRESKWDVKRLVRMMVTSAAYRQSSHFAKDISERDPENAFLSHGPRYRWPSWMLRDQALAVSGLLVEKVGGAPVKTYQPAGVWEDATFGQIGYTQDHGEALYRRSLYIFWRRIVQPTLFFDVANRQNCAVKVGRTNTPLHALVTLNDITYVEAARAFAQRILTQGGTTDEERLAFAFRLCTARSMNDAEKAALLGSLTRLRAQYAQEPEAAKKLIATGESKPDAKLDPVELAAQTALASLLLNLDETLTKE